MKAAVFVGNDGVEHRELLGEPLSYYDFSSPDRLGYTSASPLLVERVVERYSQTETKMFDGRPIYAAEGWVVRVVEVEEVVVLNAVVIVGAKDAANRNEKKIGLLLRDTLRGTLAVVLDDRQFNVVHEQDQTIAHRTERIVAYSQVEVVKRRLAGRDINDGWWL